MQELFDFFFKGNFFAKLIFLIWALLNSFFTNAQINEIPKHHPIDKNLYEEVATIDIIFFKKEEPNIKSIQSKFMIIKKKIQHKWTITKVISLH